MLSSCRIVPALDEIFILALGFLVWVVLSLSLVSYRLFIIGGFQPGFLCIIASVLGFFSPSSVHFYSSRYLVFFYTGLKINP